LFGLEGTDPGFAWFCFMGVCPRLITAVILAQARIHIDVEGAEDGFRIISAGAGPE
jgi:hypothetical protein